MKNLLILLLVCVATAGWAQKTKLKVGKKAPQFELLDDKHDTFNLKAMLETNDKVMLVFYQGGWNPYDVKYIKRLNELNAQLKKKNVQLVLITRELSKFSTKLSSENALTIPILHDVEWNVIGVYGLAYRLSPRNLPDKYKEYSAGNKNHTGTPDDMVPIPATFIIDKEQRIIYMHQDWDYRQHPSNDELLKALAQ